jgi:hypothetical protein
MTGKAQLIYNQTSVIVVHYEKTPQGDYYFYCDNKALCPYTITLNFPELNNMRADNILPAVIEVHPGTNRIMTIKKTGPQYSFRYSYSWAKGCPRAKADTSITYLLPTAPGRETRIIGLSLLATKLAGRSEPKDFYAIGFRMKPGDTVYAARRGRVTETRSNIVAGDSGLAYHREVNYVEILHDDCTFGTYTLFQHNGIFVKPGDMIEAGQPLGIVDGEKFVEGIHVQFFVRYHLEQAILDKENQPTGETEYWAYVPVNFWVRGAGRTHLDKQTAYTSEHPADIILREMSKKEARKWKEAHPNSATGLPAVN